MPKTAKRVLTFPDGTSVDLFYISTLASRLGRTSDCIRKWEVSGVLPKSGFKDTDGCRMYTKDQIDIIVQTAEEAKITQGKALSDTGFKALVHDRLSTLRDYYKLKSEGGSNAHAEFEEES